MKLEDVGTVDYVAAWDLQRQVHARVADGEQDDTVLLLASGASGVTPEPGAFAAAVEQLCADLCRQLLADAEGATKDVAIEVVGAATMPPVGA